MKILFLLFQLTTLQAFSQPAKNQIDISGQWIRVPDKFEIQEAYFGLKFENDTLYNFGDIGVLQVGKYFIRHDTILVQNFDQRVLTYKIKKHTIDSLIISSSETLFRYYSRQLEFDSTLTFSTIYLKTGSCTENCSEFEFRLDKEGSIYFKALRNCKVKGKRRFEMPVSTVHKIDSIFKWSGITNLDTSRFYGEVDDWPMELKIDYGNKFKTIKGTQWEMPFRLKGIIGRILYELRIKHLI